MRPERGLHSDDVINKTDSTRDASSLFERSYEKLLLADPTGFEPAVSGVTGRRVGRYTTGPCLPINRLARHVGIYHSRRRTVDLRPYLLGYFPGQRIHLRHLRAEDAVIAATYGVAPFVGMLEEG